MSEIVTSSGGSQCGGMSEIVTSSGCFSVWCYVRDCDVIRVFLSMMVCEGKYVQ